MASTLAGAARNRTRVILHIDLDAFYCQVEMKRVGIPAHVPCAVQQWEGLIAVNYPARAAGITRHMRRAEAKAKCPELQCVHVETIGGDAGTGNDGAVTWEDRKTQKACLERYRVASAEIIAVFHEVAPEAVVEKASIDEAYIDVTNIVDAHLQSGSAETGVAEPASAFVKLPVLESPECGNHIIGGNLDLDSEFERRLSIGAQLACHLRAQVKQKLGFTCSAGVACNKLLAKLASAMHKPSQQTVIPPRAVPELMKDLPLKKIRNFGGKLGTELEALGCSTAGDVLALPPGKLQQNFGDRAAWILYTLQGNSDEPVQVKERPKSMLAAKSFEPTSEISDVERWVGILAEELADRMIADNKQFNRRPRSLHLQYRGGGSGFGSGDRSKSCPMPRFLKAGPTAPVIAEVVMKLFLKCGDAMPCTRLAVSASDFEDGPLTEGQGSITKFFGAGGVITGTAAAAKPEQSQPAHTKGVQASEQPSSSNRSSKQAAVALMFKAAKAETGRSRSAGTGLTGAADSCHAADAQQSQYGATDAALQQTADSTTRLHKTECEPIAKQDRLQTGAGVSSESAQDVSVHAAATAEATAEGSRCGGVQTVVEEGQAMPDDGGIGELEGIDVAEQRQILHDLWLQRNASLTRTAGKRPGVGGSIVDNKRTKANSGHKGKQAQLSGLLRKPPDP